MQNHNLIVSAELKERLSKIKHVFRRDRIFLPHQQSFKVCSGLSG